MVKKGFTLSELLIGLGIVGVLAAMVGPTVTGMMPDKNKTKYIKMYNVMVNKTSEILDNPDYYYGTQDDSCTGLACQNDYNTNPATQSFKISYKSAKYPVILAHQLNLSGDIKQNEHGASFCTVDGSCLAIWEDGGNEVSVRYAASLDLNGDDGCTYNSSTCKKPTRFTFDIENDGNVIATDVMGRAFLRNSLDLRYTKEDKEWVKSNSSK